MKRQETHHLSLTFFAGAATGVFALLVGVYLASPGEERAQAMYIGAPSPVSSGSDATTAAPTPTPAAQVSPPTLSNTVPGRADTTPTEVKPNVGESGPTMVSSTPEPVVVIISPANGASLSGTVSVLVRGYAGYQMRSGKKWATPFDYASFSIDGTGIGANRSGSMYPCSENGANTNNYNDVSWWCTSKSINTADLGNGSHTFTVIAGEGGNDARASVSVTTSNTPPAQTNTPPTQQTGSSVGTLNVLSEGYLYIAGPKNGYLGQNKRVINLYAGTYTVYARAPSDGHICWSRRTVISAGKTTLMRISGIYCR